MAGLRALEQAQRAALVGLSWTAGLVLFILLAGVLSDRLDRRRVMIGADLLRAAVQLGIGALALSGSLEIWMLVVLVLVHGVGEAFFAPAFSALVPDILAPTLIPQASAIEQIVRQAARNFAGPAIGGVMVAVFGPGTSFVIDAGTFAFSAACIFAIRTRPALIREKAAGLVSELREGMAYVRTQRWLWGTLVAASLAVLFFMGPIQVLVPLCREEPLATRGPAVYGTDPRARGRRRDRDVAVGRRARFPRREVSWMMLIWAFGGGPVPRVRAGPAGVGARRLRRALGRLAGVAHDRLDDTDGDTRAGAPARARQQRGLVRLDRPRAAVTGAWQALHLRI